MNRDQLRVNREQLRVNRGQLRVNRGQLRVNMAVVGDGTYTHSHFQILQVMVYVERMYRYHDLVCRLYILAAREQCAVLKSK